METINCLWNWLKQNTTSLGDGVKIYNKDNQNLNANVFIIRARYPLDNDSYLSGEKEEHEQTIMQSIVRNEFYINFGRNFGEYLKQQTEHSKYEF